jgi:hypothetical protein
MFFTEKSIFYTIQNIFKIAVVEACEDERKSRKAYCHVSGVCATNKTGFGFDD